MKLLNILLLSLILASCTTVDVKPTDPTTEIQKTEFKLNQEILKKCPSLVNLEKNSTFDDVLVWYSKNAELYGECKSLNDKKLRLIKELTGEGSKSTITTGKD